MLGKKLLTLVCAIGVLICGACFAPVQYKPPPPPPIVNEGVKSIRVVVVDSSESHELNTASLAESIADGINNWTRTTGIQASTLELQGGPGEAVLEFRIHSARTEIEPALPGKDLQRCSLSVENSELVTLDARPIWRQRKEIDKRFISLNLCQSDELMKDTAVQEDLFRVIGRFAAYRALFQPQMMAEDAGAISRPPK